MSADLKDKQVNHENFKNVLAKFMEAENIASEKIAKVIGCPMASIGRILLGKTWPTDEMIKQGLILIEIGFKRYKKLTDAEKEKISETIGTLGGVGLGLGSVTAAVGASGTVAGLSAAGITSGLAALGGSMAGGLLLVSAIPITAGLAGYGIIKAIKASVNKKKLLLEGFEPRWERPLEE